AEARPPELRVVDAGDRAGIRLANGLAGGDDFRLHHEAAGLGELYAGGKLAIVHAAGLTTANRSHFAAQDMMDRGVPRENEPGSAATAWPARAPHGRTLAGGLPVIATSSAPAPTLTGEPRAFAVPDVAGAAGLPGGEQTRAVLARLTQGADDPASVAAR